MTADRELRVRYVEDGTRDSLAWPDPEGEAWLLGPPPGAAAADANRRRTSGRSGGGAAMPRDWRPLLVKTGRGKSAAFEKGPEDVGDHLGDAPRPPADGEPLQPPARQAHRGEGCLEHGLHLRAAQPRLRSRVPYDPEVVASDPGAPGVHSALPEQAQGQGACGQRCSRACALRGRG